MAAQQGCSGSAFGAVADPIVSLYRVVRRGQAYDLTAGSVLSVRTDAVSGFQLGPLWNRIGGPVLGGVIRFAWWPLPPVLYRHVRPCRFAGTPLLDVRRPDVVMLQVLGSDA